MTKIWQTWHNIKQARMALKLAKFNEIYHWSTKNDNLHKILLVILKQYPKRRVAKNCRHWHFAYYQKIFNKPEDFCIVEGVIWCGYAHWGNRAHLNSTKNQHGIRPRSRLVCIKYFYKFYPSGKVLENTTVWFENTREDK